MPCMGHPVFLFFIKASPAVLFLSSFHFMRWNDGFQFVLAKNILLQSFISVYLYGFKWLRIVCNACGIGINGG